MGFKNLRIIRVGSGRCLRYTTFTVELTETICGQRCDLSAGCSRVTSEGDSQHGEGVHRHLTETDAFSGEGFAGRWGIGVFFRV